VPHDLPRNPLRVLAVGAHPDDIEIGAAALLAKAYASGHEVSMLVLTDEPLYAAARRAEAGRAARQMGVTADRIHFAGLRDGHVRADGDSVARVRQLMRAARIEPDIVVTHTQADSHNDHVEANRIAHAAFRDCVFLHFSVHVSAEVDRFRPKLFVDVGPWRQRKECAVGEFVSQAGRITRHDLPTYEEKLGRIAGLRQAEAFEVGVQYGAEPLIHEAMLLSDSPFHRFWLPAVSGGTVTLLYDSGDPQDPVPELLHQTAARDRLRQAFADQWVPDSPLREQYSDTPEALDIMRRRTVVLTGGPWTNPLVRRCRPLWKLEWALVGDRAAGAQKWLRNRRTGARLTARHAEPGVLTRMSNPLAPGEQILSVAGVTAAGTRAGMEFLADPGRAPELAGIFDGDRHAQAVYSVDSSTGAIAILDVQPADIVRE